MKTQNLSLFLLRISMGWMFFYAGITKVLDPSWSAAGYLENAKGLPELYAYLLQPGVLPLVNLANEWGLALIGIALVLGIFVRIASALGIVLMALYYLALGFPYPNANSYIVDQHVIYIAALLVLSTFRAGNVWGLGNRFSK